jgi:hypothetical protein
MGIAMAHISKSIEGIDPEQTWKIDDPGIKTQNLEYVVSFSL